MVATCQGGKSSTCPWLFPRAHPDDSTCSAFPGRSLFATWQTWDGRAVFRPQHTSHEIRIVIVLCIRLTLNKEYGVRTVFPQGSGEEHRYHIHICVYVLYIWTYLCSHVCLIHVCDFVNIHISIYSVWSQKQGAWGISEKLKVTQSLHFLWMEKRTSSRAALSTAYQYWTQTEKIVFFSFLFKINVLSPGKRPSSLALPMCSRTAPPSKTQATKSHSKSAHMLGPPTSC